jgi:hypothetical protein
LLPISVKVVFSLFPTVEAAVMIVRAIKEAINPYSMAVAPDSLRKNSINCRMALSMALKWGVHWVAECRRRPSQSLIEPVRLAFRERRAAENAAVVYKLLSRGNSTILSRMSLNHLEICWFSATRRHH